LITQLLMLTRHPPSSITQFCDTPRIKRNLHLMTES